MNLCTRSIRKPFDSWWWALSNGFWIVTNGSELKNIRRFIIWSVFRTWAFLHESFRMFMNLWNPGQKQCSDSHVMIEEWTGLCRGYWCCHVITGVVSRALLPKVCVRKKAHDVKHFAKCCEWGTEKWKLVGKIFWVKGAIHFELDEHGMTASSIFLVAVVIAKSPSSFSGLINADWMHLVFPVLGRAVFQREFIPVFYVFPGAISQLSRAAGWGLPSSACGFQFWNRQLGQLSSSKNKMARQGYT